MIPKTNLETQLSKLREKRIASENILEEVQAIFDENDVLISSQNLSVEFSQGNGLGIIVVSDYSDDQPVSTQ